MNDAEILSIYNREVRQQCEWTRLTREELPHLVRYTEMDNPAGGGMVSWTDLNEQNADEAIENQIDYYRALNKEFDWKLYSYDEPSDLEQRLLAHGFIADERGSLMVAEIDRLPAEYWSMDLSIVSRITTPDEVDEIVRLESEVWHADISGFARGMKFDLVHHPDQLSVFAIWQNGHIVSAAWTHYLLKTSFATLWGGSTLKEYRRRGFYTALVAIRAREGRQRGYRFLQVDASEESRPILAKHGFRCLAETIPLTWKPGSGFTINA